ncbi:MAG: hypothetical protein JWO45_1272, partial [Spartobacteria bacterium]|nr:hypothetical protein [Spartobacteria bacterium]
TRWLCLLLLFFGLTKAVGKEVRQTAADPAQFVGSAGCRSSGCHGGAGEKRSQYLTWSRQDFHTRAYAILLNARSARIADAARIDHAETSARCTICHSPFQSVAQTHLAPTARTDEGVSCESCHGAAGAWLRGHTRPDWTYPIRVSAGMRNLRDLYDRANACVACHQNVNPELLRAGHPVLVFELDSQSRNEPRHWNETDPWVGPRSWLTGQAVALREMSWHLYQARPAASGDELTRWNALKALLENAGLYGDLNQKSPGTSESNNFPAVQRQADEMALHAATSTWTQQSVRDLLQRVTIASPTSADGARRLVLALDSLTRALNTERTGSFNIDNELSVLHDDTRNDYNFSATRFAEHLRALHGKL